LQCGLYKRIFFIDAMGLPFRVSAEAICSLYDQFDRLIVTFFEMGLPPRQFSSRAWFLPPSARMRIRAHSPLAFSPCKNDVQFTFTHCLQRIARRR